MNILFITLIIYSFLLISFVRSQSQCPNKGQYNKSCLYYDYCDQSKNLTCGNGNCGKLKTCLDIGNWTNINNSCYYLLLNIGRNYTESEIECKKLNAVLASIKTEFELKSIIDFINKTSNITHNTHIRFGLNAVSYLKFAWLDDGSTFDNDSLKWCNGEPNNYNGIEHTAALKVRANCFNDLKYYETYYPVHTLCKIESKCLNSKCQCKTDHYLTGGTTCMKLQSINEPCCENNECNNKNGLECINGKCVCANETKWYSDRQKCEKCPLQWIYGNNNCFLIIREPIMNYTESTSRCKSFHYNASLLNLNSADKLDYILPLSNIKNGLEFWIQYSIHNFTNCTGIESGNSIFLKYELSKKNFYPCIQRTSNHTLKMGSICEADRFFGSDINNTN